MPLAGYAFISSEVVDAAGHRLAELSELLSKGEQPVVADDQENREAIGELSLYVNGHAGSQAASA